jgi:predicted metal-dependent peptidase
MMSNDLTVEQRVERSHVQLMKDKRFVRWSGLFMVGKVYIDDSVPTAGTNGRDVWYGRKFVNTLTEKQLNFLVMHENMHRAFRHMTIWAHLSKEDRRCANMAMDYVINQQLMDYDPQRTMLEFIEGGCLDERFRGMDTLQVYKILRQEKEKRKRGQKGEKGEKCDNPDGPGGGDGDEGDSFDDHDWEGAADISEKDKEILERQIGDALRQGGMLAGKMGGNEDKAFDELVDPKVDWREVFRQWCKSVAAGRDQSTWRKPNRRFLHNDIIMPSMESLTVGRLVVAVDTSGSIGNAALSEFFSEVMSICKDVSPDCVDLLYWDTRVAGHETYVQGTYDALLETTKPKGGGGTDPDCIPVYITEKKLDPICVVVLTDGYVGRCDTHLWEGMPPVLWVVTQNKHWSPPAGQSVNM